MTLHSVLVYARLLSSPLADDRHHEELGFGGGRIALGGAIGMLICTVATMRSSTVHEYYNSPLLFSSPLGPGMANLGIQKATLADSNVAQHHINRKPSILSIDYWAVETRQRSIWMPLAETIRREMPANARVVTVTDSDPTLLNLARRQGWIISSRS